MSDLSSNDYQVEEDKVIRPERRDKKITKLYKSQRDDVGVNIIRSLKDEKHPQHRSNRH